MSSIANLVDVEVSSSTQFQSVEGSSTSPMLLDATCAPIQSTDRDNVTGTATVATGDIANATLENNEEDIATGNAFQKRKRAKTSEVWQEYKEVEIRGGVKKVECIHCKTRLSILTSKSTTHFKRHLESCKARKVFLQQQKMLNFQPVGPSGSGSEKPISSTLTDGKYDHAKMREAAAHWVLMHEHAFTLLEEEGFNFFMRCGIPQWDRINRVQLKNDCMVVYDMEKKKLTTMLKNVNKISLTTDLWKSKSQKIEYMVITGHFIDSSWKLQKRVLNFVHLPPPRRGIEIADSIYKCLKEWGIENKIYSISVDNASANDSAIKILKENFSRSRRLLCGGKLFHVRCCAHILNLMVQDGLVKIKPIIEDVRESVSYINQSEGRLRTFGEIVQQLQLPARRLILDCKTRWNSTYEMLSCAVKFKDVFPRFQEREPHYDSCPSQEDWEKVEEVCEILEVFSTATNLISGSDYPTANLFLSEVYRVKLVLDRRSNDENIFIQSMVRSMKDKFDKYWGECNLLMSIAAILDPRCKMRVIEFCFPKIYSEDVAQTNVSKVRDALYELYEEYVVLNNDYSNSPNIGSQGVAAASSSYGGIGSSIGSYASGWSEIQQFVRSVETIQPQKSDLDIYLEEGCYICEGDSVGLFNALEWWKVNHLKYRILSKLACDILAIPITTVASEATFSAGGRVIDSYRSSLAPETVQALLCGGDWTRNLHGVKKKNKNEKKAMVINLQVP